MGCTSWSALALVGHSTNHCTDFDDESVENCEKKRSIYDSIVEVKIYSSYCTETCHDGYMFVAV